MHLIKKKTVAIFHPTKKLVDQQLIQDEDLGGPFVFCILLGLALLLVRIFVLILFQSGRLHFGYIFGYSVMGSILIYLLVNVMSESNIGFSQTMSVLGYCLFPMVILALVSYVVPPT